MFLETAKPNPSLREEYNPLTHTLSYRREAFLGRESGDLLDTLQ